MDFWQGFPVKAPHTALNCFFQDWDLMDEAVFRRRALGKPFPEVDHLFHGGEWRDDLDSGELNRIGQRLAALPLALEVQSPNGLVGLVHADCPFDS